MKKRFTLTVASLLLGLSTVMAQNTKVTGQVLDENGDPVIGASVLVKGTTVGTITDFDGKFSLDVPSKGKSLEISYVGMKKVEVKVASNVKAVLESDTQALDEVMVVAYGTAKKSAFTGSAAAIKSEKIGKRQTSNVTNALSGEVAGVQITSTNGEPGSSPSVRIRGIGSMSAGNEPLYVVDGVPFEGGIETINPQDIESMTVLKDAASNALYGARGANGVILITTKKGTVGAKTQIAVDAKWGTNRRAIPNYNVMTDPNMYYETYYQGVYNWQGRDPQKAAQIGKFVQSALAYPIYNLNGAESLFTPEGKIDPRATVGNVYKDQYWLQPDNWFDEIFDSGNLRQEYNLRISGATDRMNYYVSAGYLDDSGIIPNSGFKRFTSRANVEYQVNSRLRIGTNISYTNSKNRSPKDQEGSSSGNMFYVSNMIAPIYPLYLRNADKSIMIDSWGNQMYDYGDGMYPGLGRPFMGQSNPASAIELDRREYTYDVISARAFAKLDIWKGLKASASWGYDLDNTRSINKYNGYYGQFAGMGGIIYVGSSRTAALNQQYLLTYNETFGLHNIDLMAGFESYNLKMQNLSGGKEKLYNPNINEIDNAINNPTVNSSTDTYATQGILARAQYNYDNKYFASLSYRRDASSRFHPDNRWGNFWSIGGGWLMNKEAFLENQSWIDMLKFKMSYGVQGNDNIGNYHAYSDQYRVTNNNDNFAVSFAYKGNKDITWESSHSFNTGFDFDFFKNRLGGTVEYFARKTTDMLYYRPVPPTLGYSTFPMNVGSMLNQGIELDLHGDAVRTKNVRLGLNFNLTHFKNKIKALAPELEGEMIDGSRIYREGESMYQMYLREYAGVNPETGGAWYYIDKKDENGNVIGREKTENWGSATRYATGDILPKVYGGLGATLETFGFDFSISMAYQLGGRVYDNSYAALMHMGGSNDAGQNWHKDILNAWTPENKNSDIPMINYAGRYANSLSTRFVTSSDYLSINNITFGYTLPKRLLKNYASSLRFYLAADNVAVFSARKGLDPRQGYVGSGNDSYSPIRSISGGVSLTF